MPIPRPLETDIPARRPSRRGTALLVVGGILVVILLLAGWFFNYMLMQNRLSRRQEQQRISTFLAFGLAILAQQKIQQETLADETQELTKYLQKPLETMGNLDKSASTRIRIDLGTMDLQKVLDEMVEPLASLGGFSYVIHYFCQGKDFTRIGSKYYPREKAGLIHLAVSTTFKKANASELVEEFHFVFKVKVTAALVPVLSKFTMYVADARGTADPYDVQASFRLNTVSTNQNGMENPSNPTGKPWVFLNAAEGSPLPMRLTELVESKRGLIYLGGGQLILGLARGSNHPGEFSEGHHFFKWGRGDGLFNRWPPENGIYFLQWDQGICSENTDAGRDWYEFVQNSPLHIFASRNSALKLLGVDLPSGKRSPTLVLGEVYRAFLSARAAKNLNPNTDPKYFKPLFLKYVKKGPPGDEEKYWREYTDLTASTEDDNIGTFVTCIDLTSRAVPPLTPREVYNASYASNLNIEPYGRSLGYISTDNQIADPLINMTSDPLIQFMPQKPSAVPASIFHTIPDPFKIIAGVTELRSMDDLLKGLQIPGSRTTWIINPAVEKRDIFDCLKARGLFDGQILNLQGWVYIEGDNALKIDKNLKVGSNGGIVLQKGDITIANQIDAKTGTGNSNHLQLITLDGKITVDTNQKVQAALLSRTGFVTIEKNVRATIHGAVAMKYFDLGSASQGANLEYDIDLAALPNLVASAVPDDLTEKKLLSFSVNPTPIFLK